jgi:anti-sigma regulatory factor (Ser/Thr protein kinase)
VGLEQPRSAPYHPPVPEVRGSFSSDPSSVPAARHLVTRALADWSCDDASWAAAQIVAELAANCALHARTGFEVRLVQSRDALRLEVTDGSRVRVQPRQYGAQATTGRGLRLVERLSQDWGVEMAATGKTVWVLLHPGEVLADDEDEGEAAAGLDALLASLDDGGDVRLLACAA